MPPSPPPSLDASLPPPPQKLYLKKQLQHQETSALESDALSSSVRSLAASELVSPSRGTTPSRGRRRWWAGLDVFSNTYYARRMALVTLASLISMALLCVFSDDAAGFWVWLSFQVTNTLLGLSALPHVRLYFVAPLETPVDEDSDAKDGAGEDRSSVGGGAETDDPLKRAALKARERRQTSFSFLRSSFHEIETKLEPFLLKRSTFLRLFESFVVMQSVLLYIVVVLAIFVLWVRNRNIWDSSVFSTAGGLGLLAVLCVYLQTLEFDRLRAHQQLQLGAGLEQEQLRHAHEHGRRPGNTSRASISVDDSIVSRRSMRNHRSQVESSFQVGTSLDIGHTAAIVEHELRRGLYEAVVERKYDKAKALFGVMEQALGSKVKVELFLLKMYSSPTLWFWSFAFSTYNPLHVACRLGDLDMVEVLLEGGINPNLMDKIAGEPFSLRLLYECCQLRPRNTTNVIGSPLHVAVMHGHSHVIDTLVNYGVNLDAVAKTSFFSQSMRVPAIFLADAADVVECLIRHRANILVVPGKGNSMGITVLQRALLQDRGELACVLEEWGGDVALTPLHEAAAAGDLAAISHIMSWGLHPDQVGEYQKGVNLRTPLHWACVMGRHAVVTALIKAGADVNAQDRLGRTPLHWAALHNHVKTVELLLASGADPWLIDHSGLTPLGFSATGGLLDGPCVELFTTHGVDVNARLFNESEDSCLHVALRNGHRETALALIETGGADLDCFNGVGRRAVECCASAELQYAVKMSSGWVDVVISFDPVYRGFAQRVRQGIEQNFITVSMRNSFDDPKGSMDIMKRASAVVCVLSPQYEHNAVCMEELAYAKYNQVPVVAISCETMNLSEELQVYLFTRQIVPFRDAIISTRRNSVPGLGLPSSTPELVFSIDEDKFKTSLQNLIDGLRDEVELHRLGGNRGPDLGSDMASIVDLPRPSSVRRGSGATNVSAATVQSERGASTSSLVSPRATTSLPRYETFRRRTLDDVVKDLLGRKSRPLGMTPAQVSFSVFLSHGDCHREFVSKLYTELRRHNIPVTLDSMSKVSSMKERILAAKNAILQCTMFLVVLSEQSSKTELVSDQLAFAEDKGKYILPIYYAKKPSIIDSTLRKLLEQEKQMLIFANDLSYGRGFDELLQDLRKEEALFRGTDVVNAVEVPAAQAAARVLLTKSRVRASLRISSQV